MNEINVIFRLYSKEISSDNITLDFSRDYFGVNAMFSMIEDVTGMMFDKGINEISRIYNFPDYAEYVFDSNIKLTFTLDNKPDYFENIDKCRSCYGVNGQGWFLSRVYVNEVEFKDTYEGIYYIENLLKTLDFFI